jgi:hypothetical protein
MTRDDSDTGPGKVFISSTASDLPEHRRQVVEAGLPLGYRAVGMEHWPAQDADAETVCLREVYRADLVIGVCAFRSGRVPRGRAVSITALVYQRAVDRNKPRLLFFMDEDHPLPTRLVETGAAGEKLKTFKRRVGSERVADFFTTGNDLRGLVVRALVAHGEAEPQPQRDPHPIPRPPKPYLPHPCTLLRSRRLVGRRRELDLLTDRVAGSASEVGRSPVLGVVAPGGMGKSALAWRFFQAVATGAFHLAWCDGPPYAHQWGLEAARAHLRALGARDPRLPPFDPAAHEPMPRVPTETETTRSSPPSPARPPGAASEGTSYTENEGSEASSDAPESGDALFVMLLRRPCPVAPSDGHSRSWEARHVGSIFFFPFLAAHLCRRRHLHGRCLLGGHAPAHRAAGDALPG